MAFRCDICGKGPVAGNHVSHAHNKKKRVFKPNLKRVRAVVDGVPRRIKACTRCIKSGRVAKAA